MSVAAGAMVGLALDQCLGEPPTRWHPVAWFGEAMTIAERYTWADRRSNGVAHVALGAGAAVAAGLLLERVLGRTAATTVAVAIAVAGKMLDAEAARIAALIPDSSPDAQLPDGGVADANGEGLNPARIALRSLVGRTADDLSAADIARAVIESVAENTVDAVTAPLLWGVLLGTPGVLAHRAVNTLDAMVGHRNERYEKFGWASARLDDLANWPSARLTAALVLLPRRHGVATLCEASRQGRHHPSPNGGLVEAAFAHRLGVTLGGVNRYGDRTEDRGRLGHGPAPTAPDIGRAIRLRREVTVSTAGTLAVLAIVAAKLRRPRRPGR
jgi:adenosylcobinamide-phosphate synthase